MRGLHGSNFYVVCVGYMAQNIFYVGCVGQIYFSVDHFFLRGSKFFSVVLRVGQNVRRGSRIFALVNFCLLDEIILLYYN